ncbi:ribosomal RNA small subunit methyltransferase I [Companilactobacillus sp. RD055328]|uniref:16S rRNA (cytidine(1402)-2'-O)-methyltransferase n=1 Tax=Companilactobacillus sp. RD055328 TaxID=2916634 RepID=UPI001FC811C0|nr:16S rRNA (cytidine(1402)-2'-O)-methyltransferase [Companilactobacillus sp. RD055328]GKQ42152.1 ribosomal RNA small subunit methyltransferase I [Companilactobacillus sp. RD055328]
MNEQKSFQDNSLGSLFLVPTPIGNLEDMTIRAINTLKEVDLIAAEDTRNTGILLSHFEVSTKQTSFHEHNKAEKIPELINKMQAGMKIAQVSDAGTPSISDPGKELVQAAIEAGIAVVPLPGATASTTALIASGLVPQPFYFYGFLARKGKQRTEEITDLSNRSETSIIYESPFRVLKTLVDLKEIMGSNRQIVTARELTKIHEAFVRGSIEEVESWFMEHEPKGEFVIMISGKDDTSIMELTDEQIKLRVQQLIDDGQKPKEAIKEVALLIQRPKNEIYDIYHEL